MANRWLVYKSIFRIDYLTQFEMVDVLGKFANNIFNSDVFKKLDDSRNLSLNRELNITFKGTYQESEATVHINSYIGPKYLWLFFERAEGIEISKIPESYPVRLLQLILDELKSLDIRISKFERIGFRTYSLRQSKSSFEEERKEYEELMGYPKNQLIKHFKSIDDLGFAINFQNEIGDLVKFKVGPYFDGQKNEFFDIIDPLKYGSIVDIDYSHIKKEFPHFKVKPLIEENCIYLTKLLKEV